MLFVLLPLLTTWPNRLAAGWCGGRPAHPALTLCSQPGGRSPRL